jgi:hypothetical protein
VEKSGDFKAEIISSPEQKHTATYTATNSFFAEHLVGRLLQGRQKNRATMPGWCVSGV